jgi:hypothetical protein
MSHLKIIIGSTNKFDGISMSFFPRSFILAIQEFGLHAAQMPLQINVTLSRALN